MQQSFFKNYVNIYFYQTLSVVLGIISLFIVVPYLSDDKSIYGIYSVCLSTMIFLSYADIGFMSAGQKYAAECFVQNERGKEMEYVGLAVFILFVLVLVISGVFVYLGINPSVLIDNIQEGHQTEVARRLMFTLAFFAPLTVLQRMLQIIYGIRLKDYLLQRITIVGNIIKITAVFYFFAGGRYNIVGYFLFIQSVGMLCSIFALVQAQKIFNYDLKELFHKIRFNKSVFNKTRGLAFSSLGVTISWILYYEIDSFVIARLMGANAVAVFAIGMTVLTYFRTLLGILFSPFTARFNHFVGGGNISELQNFVKYVMSMTFPLVVYPIIAVVLLAEPLIISWVGENYQDSVVIVRWLVLCNILAFITYPTGIVLMALEKIKLLYIINISMPLIYWLGIYFTWSVYGVSIFAVSKFIVFLLSGVGYFLCIVNFLQINVFNYLKEIIFPYLPGLLVMIVFLLNFDGVYNGMKNSENLLLNVVIIIVGLVGAWGICLITSKPWRMCFVKGMQLLTNR